MPDLPARARLLARGLAGDLPRASAPRARAHAAVSLLAALPAAAACLAGRPRLDPDPLANDLTLAAFDLGLLLLANLRAARDPDLAARDPGLADLDPAALRRRGPRAAARGLLALLRHVGVAAFVLLVVLGHAGVALFLAAAVLLLADAVAGHPDAAHPILLTAAGLLGAAAGGLAFFRPRQAPDALGSARFADPDEVRDLLGDPAGATDPGADAGLIVGRDVRTGRLLRHRGPAHLLTVAPTRAGKGAGSILPNLLLARRPVLCVDPKGENARVAARARGRYGPVWVLDPFAASGRTPAAYNPLDVLDPDGPDLAEDAATLADALVADPPGQAQDPHWNEEARALIAGLLMLVACHEPPHRRTLATLREHLTLPPDDLRGLLRIMQDSDAAGGLVAGAANRHLGKADREASGVLSAAQRHTHFLDSPRIAAATARSDLRLADLKRTGPGGEVATLFLVLPPDRLDSHGRWLRLLVAQAIAGLARETARPPAPVLLLLDEFAALGRLAPVERAMGLMAGYGLQLWPVLQDLAQLRSIYGRSAGTFLANAGVLQAFAVNDHETARWLSDTLGDATVAYETRGESRPSVPFAGGGGGSVSTTGHLAARRLLGPDEVMRLPPDLMLLSLQGRRPVLARKVRHFVDPEFRGLFDPPRPP